MIVRNCVVLSAMLLLFGCSTVIRPMPAESSGRAPHLPQGAPIVIAVLPFENLSASPAPLKEIRASLVERLQKQGVNLLGEKELLSLMARHRIRYTGGVDKRVVEAFRREAGVGGVLITSLGLYMNQNPPKVTLVSRLAGMESPSKVMWADSVTLAGDDSPGILGLGLVESMNILMPRALDRLAESLAGYLGSGQRIFLKKMPAERRFRPRSYYRSPVLDRLEPFRIAVLPVVNHSDRKNAGELLTGVTIGQIMNAEGFELLEPGMVREELLRYRIVTPEGASLDVADVLFGQLNVDLLLTGKVMDYDDTRVSEGAPRVTFSLQLIERKSKEVVWASQSANVGNEGVFFFDAGKVTTAHALASRMMAEVVQQMRRFHDPPAKFAR